MKTEEKLIEKKHSHELVSHAIENDQSYELDYIKRNHSEPLGDTHTFFNDSDSSDEEVDEKEKSVNSKLSLVIAKTFCKRYFGPVYSGSLRSSIFTLSILSLGSGCLSIPQKFTHMSLFLGIITVIICGLAAYKTLNYLIHAAICANILNYSKVVEYYCGKGFSRCLDFIIMLFCFGQMVLLQVISNITFI